RCPSYGTSARRAPHSFPTRRSSDLIQAFNLPKATPATARNSAYASSVAAITRASSRSAGTQPSSLPCVRPSLVPRFPNASSVLRSEEHTSELQSRENLVCRLLLEKN